MDMIMKAEEMGRIRILLAQHFINCYGRDDVSAVKNALALFTGDVILYTTLSQEWQRGSELAQKLLKDKIEDMAWVIGVPFDELVRFGEALASALCMLPLRAGCDLYSLDPSSATKH